MGAKSTPKTDHFDISVAFVQESLDAMSEGVSVARLIDGELHFVVCNKCFIDLLEFPDSYREVPKPFADYIRFNAERGEYGDGDVEDLVRERVELAKGFKPHNFVRTRPNGTALEIVGKPLPSGDGFITTYTDITDRHVAETYSDVLVQAFNRSGSGLVIFDQNDKLVFVNDTLRTLNSSLVGETGLPDLTYDDWGKAILDLGLILNVENREAWLKEWQNVRFTPGKNMELLRQDNSWRFVDAVKLDNGYTVVVSNNITELKKIQTEVLRAKEDAEFASRAKTDFLANMSHELRTPLNSIIGFSELLQTSDLENFDKKKMGEYLGDINGSGRHLLRLISDILDISKIEVGELKLDEEPLCLRELTEEALRMIQHRAQRQGATIKHNERPPKVRLHADETRIKQILLNLLTNSIKFTAKDGRITVSWHFEKDGSLTMQVADSGTGMSAESIKIALEPFGQVAQSLTREHEGTGLGLPLSRRLAELHGAKLTIISELGKGTTVNVTFPPHRVVTDFEDDDQVSQAQ